MNFIKSLRYGMVGNTILYGGISSIFGYIGIFYQLNLIIIMLIIIKLKDGNCTILDKL
jgi:hypothetical protein